MSLLLGGNANNPRITVDSLGNAIAVWEQSDGTRENIWANWTVGGAWQNTELIEADNTSHADSPQVAVDAVGNFIAVWQQGGNIWANRLE